MTTPPLAEHAEVARLTATLDQIRGACVDYDHAQSPLTSTSLAETILTLIDGHQCCACFTHNNLPCCNAGHPAEQDIDE